MKSIKDNSLGTNIESWMVSVIVGVVTYVATFVTMKNQTAQNSKDIRELQNENKSHKKEDDMVHGKMWDKLDETTKEVAEHKVKINSVPTMKDVDDKFVSKEMFRQMEKHIDDKFDVMGKSLSQILSNQNTMSEKLDKIKDN